MLEGCSLRTATHTECLVVFERRVKQKKGQPDPQQQGKPEAQHQRSRLAQLTGPDRRNQEVQPDQEVSHHHEVRELKVCRKNEGRNGQRQAQQVLPRRRRPQDPQQEIKRQRQPRHDVEFARVTTEDVGDEVGVERPGQRKGSRQPAVQTEVSLREQVRVEAGQQHMQDEVHRDHIRHRQKEAQQHERGIRGVTDHGVKGRHTAEEMRIPEGKLAPAQGVKVPAPSRRSHLVGREQDFPRKQHRQKRQQADHPDRQQRLPVVGQPGTERRAVGALRSACRSVHGPHSPASGGRQIIRDSGLDSNPSQSGGSAALR